MRPRHGNGRDEAGREFVRAHHLVATLFEQHHGPAQDLIVHKTQASAFFGTPLCGILAAERCDMLVVAGATTSGCVRASTVDAMQYGFPPFVVREAVSDRSAAQHESNLVDMDSKYADVVALESMLRDLRTLQR